MNLFDKRANTNFIKSRVIKTSSKCECDNCNIEDKPCPNSCPRITTECHLDTGYILYLSSNEIKHISDSYKTCLDNLKSDTPI